MNATKQSHPEGCSAGGIVISQRAFTAFLFWVGEILQDFVTPKQALINAFYNMSANFWFATAKLLHFFELRKSNTKKIAIHIRKYKWR